MQRQHYMPKNFIQFQNKLIYSLPSNLSILSIIVDQTVLLLHRIFNQLEYNHLFLCTIQLLVLIFKLFEFFTILHHDNYLNLRSFLMLFNDPVHDTLIRRIFIFILRNFNLRTAVLKLFYHLHKYQSFFAAVEFLIYSIIYQYKAQKVYLIWRSLNFGNQKLCQLHSNTRQYFSF